MTTFLASPAPVVAHQGGWDELLLFGVPVVVAIVAVRWAEQRAKARRKAEAAGGEDAKDRTG
jgi:hypothetical protein